MNDLIDTIKDSIENERCVLVLGPDLYVKEIDGNIVERKQFFSELEKELSGCIYFPNEDVFDFNNISKRSAKIEIKKFYSDGGDMKLLELISSIKLPLIINASPDLSLKNFCDRNGIELQFNSFQGAIDENKKLTFTINNPLLYNVFGNAKDAQEIIIDYKGLFEHIQNILPKNSFPSEVRGFLSKASCFIFLGFKFDSWIFQLLVHKILNHKENEASNNEDNILRLSPSVLDKIKLGNIEMEKRDNKIKSTNINKESLINIIMSSSVGMEFTDISPAQLIDQVLRILKKDGADNFYVDVLNQEKYSCYLSYAHHYDKDIRPNIGEITEIFMNSFETKKTELEIEHLKLILDNKELRYGQSIDSFMTRIGKGKTVILIISDKYLKSSYCMTEAMRIFKHNNDDERIFVIKVKDSLNEEKVYEKFWKDQALSLIETDKTNVDDINNALDFSNEMPLFLKKLEKTKYLEINLSDLRNENGGKSIMNSIVKEKLNSFITDLFNKLKE